MIMQNHIRGAARDPAISVAMSVYNGAPFMALAIESVLAQTFPDFEFLILNDGSSDDSAAIIDAYAARDPRIRAIHRENKGLIVSLNQLVAESRAPLIARMDGDDICRPERFAKQIAFLAANPDYGVVGTWTADIDERGRPFHLSGADHPVTHEDFIATIGHGTLLCHPSVMIRRDVLVQSGGYHAAFRHCEDYDLWLRLASLTKLGSLPERLLLYRHSEGQVSNRHLFEQQIGVAVSQLAWRERRAGRPDPTAHLSALPPLDALDSLFGREGVSREARAMVASSILYSPIALSGRGLDLVLDHIRDGHPVPGLPRTVLRLLRFGQPIRALRLASALVAA